MLPVIGRLRQDFKTIARAYDECADIVIEAEDLPNVVNFQYKYFLIIILFDFFSKRRN
jgi:hypothetical protein